MTFTKDNINVDLHDFYIVSKHLPNLPYKYTKNVL